jgi:co-chaperonin GroES (HSP10)
MSVVITQRKMAHARDPGEVIAEAVGNLDDVKVFHNLVLIGIYERPEKTAGGIIISDKTQKEDVHQGVIGYVLKTGPAAFVDDANNKFYGVSVSPGDWVIYRPSDTWMTSINGKACRMIEDAKIKGSVGHPDRAY